MTSIQKNNSRVVTLCRGIHGGRPAECARDRPPPRQRNICGATGRAKPVCVRRSHMRSRPHYDELPTFRGETKKRRLCKNGGSSCAMDERRCRHDMMMVVIKKKMQTRVNRSKIFKGMINTQPGGSQFPPGGCHLGATLSN